MPEGPITRRAFLAASGACAAVIGAHLSGCAAGTAPETLQESSAASSGAAAEEQIPEETSPDASNPQPEAPEVSGSIAYALNCSMGDLSPWGPDALAAARVNLPVLEGLYEIDPVTFEAYPALAAGAPTEITMNVYEIKLREFALFSDGSTVTADDVVASFKLAQSSEYGAFSELLSFIAEMEATSDELVTVVAKVPMDDVLERRLALVKVVPAGTTSAQLSAGATGTGPWRIDSIDGKRAAYARNTYYTGSHPALVDKLTCTFAPDPQARADSIASGGAQAIEDAQRNDEKLADNASVAIEAVEGFNPALLVFNTRKKPFDDKRVRQAILYAIDAAGIAEDVFGGKAHAATCFLDAGNPDFQKASRIFATDAEKARSLLEAAGVKELSFVLDTGQEPWMEPMANSISASLEQAGITVEVHAFPLPELYAGYMDTDDETQTFSVALTTCDPTLLGRDADLVMRWFFSNDEWMEKRSGWKGDASYKELQKLMTKAATTEANERAAVWKEAFDLVSEQVPLYPVLHCDRTTAFRPAELDGFEPAGAPGISMLDVSLPAKKQGKAQA